MNKSIVFSCFFFSLLSAQNNSRFLIFEVDRPFANSEFSGDDYFIAGNKKAVIKLDTYTGKTWILIGVPDFDNKEEIPLVKKSKEQKELEGRLVDSLFNVGAALPDSLAVEKVRVYYKISGIAWYEFGETTFREIREKHLRSLLEEESRPDSSNTQETKRNYKLDKKENIIKSKKK